MAAYLETLRFLEQSNAFESVGQEGQHEAEFSLQDNDLGADMGQADVMERKPASPPPMPAVPDTRNDPGEIEWMRNLVGRDTKVRLLVSGDMGPKEIGRLIKLLEAQKMVLDEDEDENS